jgi:hypothetical protein
MYRKSCVREEVEGVKNGNGLVANHDALQLVVNDGTNPSPSFLIIENTFSSLVSLSSHQIQETKVCIGHSLLSSGFQHSTNQILFGILNFNFNMLLHILHFQDSSLELIFPKDNHHGDVSLQSFVQLLLEFRVF